MLEEKDPMQSGRPHAVLRNDVPAHLCGAQRKDELKPCQVVREECTRHCGADLRSKPGERCPTPPMLNGRCRMHGGRSLRGLASPSFVHGRFSRSIPARLSKSYEEALNDPRRLELSEELAVIISRNQELLNSLYSGESDGLWMRLNKVAQRAEDARRKPRAARERGDMDTAAEHSAAAAEHLNEVFRLIRHGAKDAERWRELMANFDQQRKLAESERKRRVEERQVATIDELMAVMGAIVTIIQRHVPDPRIRSAIGNDIEALVSSNTAKELS